MNALPLKYLTVPSSVGRGKRPLRYLFRSFPAKPEFVTCMRQEIDFFIADMVWSEDDRSAILLASGEACTNAVIYGSPECRVTIIARFDPEGELRIDIANDGAEFSPNLFTLCTLPDSDSEHGRGFALMMALMDDVQVFTRNRQTIVRLFKCQHRSILKSLNA